MMVFSIEPEGICALTIRKLSTNKAIATAAKMAISHWKSSFAVESFSFAAGSFDVDNI